MRRLLRFSGGSSMKRLSRLLFAGALALGLVPLALASLTSVNETPTQVLAAEREDRESPDIVSSNAINMKVIGGVLFWDAIGGATNYQISIHKDGVRVYFWETSDTHLPIIAYMDGRKVDSGNYSISVYGVNSSLSAFYMTYYYTSNVNKLADPSNLGWLGNNAVWEYVEDAEVLSYTLVLYDFDGVVATVKNAESPTDLSEYNPQDGWTFTVQSIGDSSLGAKRPSNIVESPARGSRTRTNSTIESSNALNMRISSGILAWDAVDGATGYDVTIRRFEKTVGSFPGLTNTVLSLDAQMDNLKLQSYQYYVEVSAVGVAKKATMQYYYTSNVDQLESPKGLYWWGYKARWDEVEGAASYTVGLYGFSGLVSIVNVTDAIYNFEGNLPQDGWTFKVKANGGGTLNSKRDSWLAESPTFVSQKYDIGVIIVDSTNDVTNQGGQVYLETDRGSKDWTSEGNFSRKATYGSTATLKAKPDTGYQFLGWRLNGDWASTELEYTFTVNDGGTYYAMFQAIDFYFVLQPVNKTIGVGNAVNVVWSTNYIPDETEIQNWDETTQSWDQWDVNHPTNKQDDYDFQNNVVGPVRFRLVATSTVYGTAISDEFTVSWVEPNIDVAQATISAPVGGENPSTTITTTDERFTVSVQQWRKDFGDRAVLSASDEFEVGKDYQLNVYFLEKSGYSFTASTVFKVNDKTSGLQWGGGLGMRQYYFTAEAPAVTEYTVYYGPGEGQGSGDLDYVNSGTTITLSTPQALGFTPIEGKMFDAWSINEDRYEPGEEYTVNANTVIIALWKNVPVTPSALSVTYSGGDLETGSKVDLSKIAIQVTFSNETVQDVDSKEVEYWYGGSQITDFKNYVFASAGTYSITVKYLGLESSFSVKAVDPVVLSGIEITGTYKTEYTVGDSFSTEGMVVKAVYSDSSKVILDINAVTFTGYNMGQVGEQTVTVAYEGKTITYQIVVSEPPKTLESIYISGNYNDHYTVGDEFSSEGIVVTAVYSDASEETIDLANVTFTGYDMSQTGEQTVTVTYEGKTTTFTIIVEAVPEQSSEPAQSSEPIESSSEPIASSDPVTTSEQTSFEPTSSEPIDTSEQSSEPSSEPVVSSSPTTTSEPTSSEPVVSSEPTSSQEPISSDSQAVSSETPASSSEAPTEDKGGLGGGAIAGIIVGSVAVAGIGGFSVVWFGVKKKSFADLLKIFKRK